MIKSYQVEQNLNTTDGTTANISFGLRADSVPIKVAHEIESEFSKFLGRVTGGSVTMTQSTTRTIEWSDKEKDAIRKCKSVAEARRKYKAEFPDSSRSKQAIKTKFLELRKNPAPAGISAGSLSPAPGPGNEQPAPKTPPTPKEVVAVSKKSAPAKKSAKKPAKEQTARSKAQQGRGNKYGIPSELSKTDIKKYQRLWFRCSSKGIMYEEALAMEGKTKPRGIRKKKESDTVKQLDKAIALSNKAKTPKKPKVKHERLPYKMKNKQPDKVSTESLLQLNCDKIVTGIKVRQVKPVDGKIFFGTGTVTARNGDLVEVRNGGGKKYTLDVQNLEIATKPQIKPPEEVPSVVAAPPADDPQPPAAIDTDQSTSTLKVGDTVRQIAGFPAWHGVGIVKRAPPDRPLEALVGFDNGQSWCLRKNLRRTMAGEAV